MYTVSQMSVMIKRKPNKKNKKKLMIRVVHKIQFKYDKIIFSFIPIQYFHFNNRIRILCIFISIILKKNKKTKNE